MAGRGYSADPWPHAAPHLGRKATRHGGARIRFLGGRDMKTAERSRGTSKKRSGRFGDGLVPAKATGFLGAPGHSVGGRSLLSSEVGVLGSSSSPSSSATAAGVRDSATTSSSAATGAGRGSPSGSVVVEADAWSGAGSAAAALVLIGGSAGRTSAAGVEVIPWRGKLREMVGCGRGEEAGGWKLRLGKGRRDQGRRRESE